MSKLTRRKFLAGFATFISGVAAGTPLPKLEAEEIETPQSEPVTEWDSTNGTWEFIENPYYELHWIFHSPGNMLGFKCRECGYEFGKRWETNRVPDCPYCFSPKVGSIRS